MSRKPLSHVDSHGRARMVDVSGKSTTSRRAVAAGWITMNAEAIAAVRENRLAKGDVLSAARMAGIMAAKRTAEWIPLCHQVPLQQVEIEFELDVERQRVGIRATALASAVTGVEMEALVAVSAAGLTVYDMIKAVDREAVLGPIGVLEKSGGRSGSFARPAVSMGVVSGEGR